MLTTGMIDKAEELQDSHDELIKFMDEIVLDIETLKLVLNNRRGNLKSYVDVIDAGNLIVNAREEISE